MPVFIHVLKGRFSRPGAYFGEGAACRERTRDHREHLSREVSTVPAAILPQNAKVPLAKCSARVIIEIDRKGGVQFC